MSVPKPSPAPKTPVRSSLAQRQPPAAAASLFYEPAYPDSPSPVLTRAALPALRMSSFKYYRSCVVSAVCWILVTLLCGVLLGVPSLNFSQEFDYGQLCANQQVCSVQFTLTKAMDVRLYVRLLGVYQNNQ